jgi:hypothetical protein
MPGGYRAMGAQFRDMTVFAEGFIAEIGEIGFHPFILVRGRQGQLSVRSYIACSNSERRAAVRN